MLRGRIESNALKLKPSTRAGVMITGGGYQGKTETACEVAAEFEDAVAGPAPPPQPVRHGRDPGPVRPGRLLRRPR